MEKQNSKPRNKRCYNFNIVTYLPVADVEKYVSRNNVKNYAFITHDKDVYDEDIYDGDTLLHSKGDLKEPHIHLVVTFKDARMWTAVCKDFADFEQNTRVECVSDLESCLRYLTHDGEKGKYKYSRTDVQSDYGYFRGDWSSKADNNAFCIINDMENGYTHLELVRIYGREYVINYAKYNEMRCRIFGHVVEDTFFELRKENAELKDENDLLRCELKKLQRERDMLEKSLARCRHAVVVLGQKSNTVLEDVWFLRNPFDE